MPHESMKKLMIVTGVGLFIYLVLNKMGFYDDLARTL